MRDERLAAELQRLYWESDVSVGEIARRLGISRRALYDALPALPAGAACPDCGAALVYTNRTRRAAGQASCPECGSEHAVVQSHRAMVDAGEPSATDSSESSATDDRSWAEPDATVEQEWDAGRLAPIPAVASYRLERALLLGAAALVGMAAGAILVLLTRRRSS